MATGRTRYRAFGLTWECPFDCPELHPADHGSEAEPVPGARVPRADVLVTLGEVPVALPSPRISHPFCQAHPGEFLFNLDDVGRFLIRNGAEIVVDPAAPAARAQPHVDPAAAAIQISQELRLFLFGLGATIVLHQRGVALPLHASAVEVDGGAVLFAGYSGAGKSTLLAELVGRGYRMMADDVTAVEVLRAETGVAVESEGLGAVRGCPETARQHGPTAPLVGVTAHSAFPQLKLWTDAARHTGVDVRGLSRVRPSLEKYAVPAVTRFVAASAPVRLVYALTSQNRSGISFEPLALREAFRLLLYRTAGLPLLKGLGLRASHFALVTALSSRVSAVRIRRPTSGGSVRDLADAVEADIERRLRPTISRALDA